MKTSIAIVIMTRSSGGHERPAFLFEDGSHYYAIPEQSHRARQLIGELVQVSYDPDDQFAVML